MAEWQSLGTRNPSVEPRLKLNRAAEPSNLLRGLLEIRCGLLVTSEEVLKETLPRSHRSHGGRR